MEDAYTMDGKDWVSKLPDSILCHILSFLPKKEVVRTCILSKRWEYLWISMPNLDLSDITRLDSSVYMNRVSYSNFVNWVLAHHDGVGIKKCHLSCYTPHAFSNMYSWTCAVIAFEVQELTLKTDLLRVGELPWSLLTCKTLVALRICGRFVLNFPTYICLPKLKILHLNSVIYGDDASMEKLFSSCPVLEELDIKRHDWDGVGTMNISVLSLKRLSISSVQKKNYEFKVVIDAPNLEYLELDDYTHEYYSVTCSPSLVEAHVHGVCVSGLLEGISNVKLLYLSGTAMMSLHTARLNNLPTFHVLTHLELGIDDDGLELLPRLLHSSPNLKVLVFKEGLVKPLGKGRSTFNWRFPQFVPGCLILHLNTIKIHNFLGTPQEVDFVKYFLKHAAVLDKMTIDWYDFSSDLKSQKNLVNARADILAFPRNSYNCELIFHHCRL